MEFLGKCEFNEFVKRMEGEHSRVNHRIHELENEVKEIVNLTIAVNSMAQSIEAMVHEQKKQGEHIEAIEARDGNKWRNLVSYVITLVVGIIAGAIVKQIGL